MNFQCYLNYINIAGQTLPTPEQVEQQKKRGHHGGT
uniref:Uncharacterized protein n=1 Tax=Meloidogyne hapla TaxID=6305 RepID=A0A1I8BFK0_MELHA